MVNWEMKGKPALVIIHMQSDVIGVDGNPAFRPVVEAVKQSGIVPRQQALLKAFREKNLPIIYVVAVVPKTGPLPAYGGFWEVIASVRSNPAAPTNIEVIPELAPQSGESVISNWPLGAFSNSTLEQFLKEHGVETLVLSGVATDIAVLATTLQAVESGYSTIVPRDASISPNARAHEVIMGDIFPTFTLTPTTEDVLVHL